MEIINAEARSKVPSDYYVAKYTQGAPYDVNDALEFPARSVFITYLSRCVKGSRSCGQGSRTMMISRRTRPRTAEIIGRTIIGNNY